MTRIVALRHTPAPELAARPMRWWAVLAAAIVPLALLTIYLLWLWPRPHGISLIGELVPYLVSIAAGLPFAIAATPRGARIPIGIAYVGTGLVLLWFYALLVLCTSRNVCL